VVANALDDGSGAAVSHAEPLADRAVDVQLAAGGAVEDNVACNDVSVCLEGRFRRRLHDDPPARKALADIVVGISDKVQRNARNQECTEALACGTAEVNVQRTVRQALRAAKVGDAIAQYRADRPVNVADGHFDTRRLGAFDGGAGLLEYRPVQVVFELARAGVSKSRLAVVRIPRLGQDG